MNELIRIDAKTHALDQRYIHWSRSLISGIFTRFRIKQDPREIYEWLKIKCDEEYRISANAVKAKYTAEDIRFDRDIKELNEQNT